MPLFLADAPATHEVAAAFAFDSTFVAQARYAHGLADAVGQADLQAGLTITAPLFTGALLSDGKLALDVATVLPIEGRFALQLDAGTALARAKDVRATLVGWSVEAGVHPGVYWQRARLTLDVAYRPTLATHIRHASVATDAFDDRYPGARGGPQDGWYRGTSSRIGLGASGALASKQGLFAAAGGGWSRLLGPLPSFPDIGVLPFQTWVQAGVQW